MSRSQACKLADQLQPQRQKSLSLEDREDVIVRTIDVITVEEDRTLDLRIEQVERQIENQDLLVLKEKQTNSQAVLQKLSRKLLTEEHPLLLEIQASLIGTLRS